MRLRKDVFDSTLSHLGDQCPVCLTDGYLCAGAGPGGLGYVMQCTECGFTCTEHVKNNGAWEEIVKVTHIKLGVTEGTVGPGGGDA